MFLCPECVLLGYCRELKTRIVGGAELADPAFVADVKAYAHAYARHHRLSNDRWPDHLCQLYCRYLGEIIDDDGETVTLDTEVFESKTVRYWFRDFCKPAAPGTTPHIRREAWERVRVMATILRADDPVGTRLWGVRVANDIDAVPPPLSPSRAGRCAVLSGYRLPSLIRPVGGIGWSQVPPGFHPSPDDDDEVPF